MSFVSTFSHILFESKLTFGFVRDLFLLCNLVRTKTLGEHLVADKACPATRNRTSTSRWTQTSEVLLLSREFLSYFLRFIRVEEVIHLEQTLTSEPVSAFSSVAKAEGGAEDVASLRPTGLQTTPRRNKPIPSSFFPTTTGRYLPSWISSRRRFARSRPFNASLSLFLTFFFLPFAFQFQRRGTSGVTQHYYYFRVYYDRKSGRADASSSEEESGEEEEEES